MYVIYAYIRIPTIVETKTIIVKTSQRFASPRFASPRFTSPVQSSSIQSPIYPMANTDLFYFSAPSYYKALLHFRVGIIVLTCPDNKSARYHQPKSCVPAKSHKSQ